MSNRISGKEEKWVSDLEVNTWWALEIHREFSTLTVGRYVTESGSGDSSSRIFKCTLRGRPFRFLRLTESLNACVEDLEIEGESITFRVSLLEWDDMIEDVCWDICEKARAFCNGIRWSYGSLIHLK